MNSNNESTPPNLSVATPEPRRAATKSVAVPALASPQVSGGVRSRLKLDFNRSPDVIFALGVGLIVLYYVGIGLGKLIRLVVP